MKSANPNGAELARAGHRDKKEIHIVYVGDCKVELYAQDDLVAAAFTAINNAGVLCFAQHCSHRITGQRSLQIWTTRSQRDCVGEILAEWLAEHTGGEIVLPPKEETL